MAACGALILMVVLQAALPGASPPDRAAGLAPRRTRPLAPPQTPAYAAILAAPLFAPDRKPGPDDDVSAAGGPTMTGYAALGVATSRTAASAVVSTPAGKVVTVKRGEIIDGWTLAELTPTKLTFEQKGARHELIVGAPAVTAADPATEEQAADQ
jgi:general secretion pathway protein N